MGYNDLWLNSAKDYVGCTRGTGDGSFDPMFFKPSAGNYRLLEGSSCINRGDPVERLAANYLSGNLVTVDKVTNLAVGDTVWITDGVNTEASVVRSKTTNAVTVSPAFMNKYLVAKGAYIYTGSSDSAREPAPGNARVDLGAFGNTTKAMGLVVK